MPVEPCFKRVVDVGLGLICAMCYLVLEMRVTWCSVVHSVNTLRVVRLRERKTQLTIEGLTFLRKHIKQ